MSTESDHRDSVDLPVFGSPYRRGREDPLYQADRLRRMAGFALLLARAHERQMQHVWRELYRVGRSWSEQRDWISRLEAQLNRSNIETAQLAKGWDEQKAVLDSQKEYISQLEQERDRLWAEAQRIAAGWEEQKRFIDAQQARICEMESELARLRLVRGDGRPEHS